MLFGKISERAGREIAGNERTSPGPRSNKYVTFSTLCRENHGGADRYRIHHIYFSTFGTINLRTKATPFRCEN